MLAAYVVTAPTDGGRGLRDLLAPMGRWRVRWPWWLAALSPVAFFALALPLARLLQGRWPIWSDFSEINGLPDIGLLGVWALLVLVNGFGGETGGRLFANPQLQQGHGPLAASLLVPLWAFWHLSTFRLLESFAGFDPGTAVGWLPGLTAGAVALTWLSNRSGGSILLVALRHGAPNAASAPDGARDDRRDGDHGRDGPKPPSWSGWSYVPDRRQRGRCLDSRPASRWRDWTCAGPAQRSRAPCEERAR
jgi:hypothetical protein